MLEMLGVSPFEVGGEKSKLLSLSLLLKTARIAAEVLRIAAVAVCRVVAGGEGGGVVMGCETVVGGGGEGEFVAFGLVVFADIVVLPWWVCQCLRVKACRCLVVQGFGLLLFFLRLGAFLALGAHGRKNIS